MYVGRTYKGKRGPILRCDIRQIRSYINSFGSRQATMPDPASYPCQEQAQAQAQSKQNISFVDNQLPFLPDGTPSP